MLALAWRNIWRHTRRTLLTALAIGFALAVLMFFMALQLNSYEASINANVSIFHGHLQIQAKGYFEKPEIRNAIEAPAEISAAVKKLPLVKAAALRALGFALVSSAQRTYGVQVIGVEPQNEPRLSTVPHVIRAGRYLADATVQEAVVGAKLAKNLGVGPGGELTLLGQAKDGSLALTVLPVAGIFETGSPELDRNVIEIPLPVFQEIFGMGEDAHTIVIAGEKLEKLSKLEKILEQELESGPFQGKDLTVLRWDELLPGLKQSIQLDMAAGWLFYISLLLVVTLSILNTFLMSVLERTREFGVMMALGAKPLRISRLIFTEAALLGGVGLLGGAAAGYAIIFYYGAYGFSIPGTEEILRQWALPGTLYPRPLPAVVAVPPLVILSATLLSVLYPALRVLRLKPMAALQS